MKHASSFVAASVASLFLLACVSDDNNPPLGTPEEAGTGSSSGGFDATVNDSSVDGAAADSGDGSQSSSGGADAGDASLVDAAPVTCADAGTGRCLVILASNQGNPEGLVLSGGYLYWIEEGLPQHIHRINLAGGDPEDLGPAGAASSYSGALAVVGGTMYWNDQYNATIYSAPTGGVPDAGATVLSTVDGGAVTSMVVGASMIYWTDYNAGKVYGAPIGGGPASVVASPGGTPYGIATDGTTLYWANTTASAGSIQAISLVDGGAEFTLQAGVSAPQFVTVSGGTLYFASGSAFDIYSMPASGMTDGGLPPILVATGTAVANSFAYDGVNVYWTNGSNPGGEVLYAPPAQASTALALGMTAPGSITYDLNNVYWANFAYGAVFMMAKP